MSVERSCLRVVIAICSGLLGLSLNTRHVVAAPKLVEVNMMCGITAVQTHGQDLVVTVARGKNHGIVVGARGDIFSPGEQSGIGDVVARAEVIEVGAETSKVRALSGTLLDASKVVVRGQIELRALLPADVYRGILFELYLKGIEFIDNGRAPIVPPAELLSDTTDATEKKALANMVIAGREVVEFTHELKHIQTRTRWKGQTVTHIMSHNDESDYLAFLRFVRDYPGKYIGTSWKISETYATWLINDSFPASKDLYLELMAASAKDLPVLLKSIEDNYFRFMLDEMRGEIADLPRSRHSEGMAISKQLDRLLAARARTHELSPLMRAIVTEARARALHLAPKRDLDAIKAYREASSLYIQDGSEGSLLSGVVCLNNNTGLLSSIGRDDDALAELATIRALIGRVGPLVKSPMYAAHLQLAEVYPSTIAAGIMERRGQNLELIELLNPLVQRISSVGATGARQREIEVLTLIAEAHGRLGNLDKASELYGQMTTRASELGDLDQMARTNFSLAELYHARGRYEEAHRSFESSATIAEQAGLQDSVAKALAASGQSLWNMGRFEDALAKHTAALALRDPVTDRSKVAWQRVQMAQILVDKGDREKARTEFESALAIYRELGSRSQEASVQIELGELHRKLKRADLAEVEFKAARDTYKSLKEVVSEANALQKMASARLDVHDSATALKYIEQSIALLSRTSSQQELVNARLWLARIRAFLEDPRGARAIYTQLLPKKPEADPGNAIDILISLSDLDIREGALEEAARRQREALTLVEATKDMARMMSLLESEAQLKSRQGDFEGQVATLRRAVEMIRKTGDKTRTVSAVQNLAWALIDTGQLTEGKALAEESLTLARQVGDTYQTAWSLNTLSKAHQFFADTRAELETLEEAYGLMESVKHDYGRAAITFNRALTYSRLRDLERALAGFNEAERFTNRMNDAQFRVAIPAARGMTLVMLGRYEEADKDLSKARDLARRLFPGRLPHILAWSARLASERKQFDKALEYAEEAVRIEDKMTSASHVSRAMLGRVLSAAGRDEEAREALETAIGRARKAGGAIPWEPLFELGKLKAKIQQRKDAIALLEEAVKTIELGETVLPEDSAARSHTDKVEVYRLLVKLLLAEGRIDAAFQYLERSKVSELKNFDRRLGVGDDQSSALAMELDIQEKRLQRMLDEELAATSPNDSKIKQLDELIAEAKKKRADFMEKLDRNDAAFDRYAVRPLQLEKLQEYLTDGILVIAPVVLDDGVVVFAMTKDALTHYTPSVSKADVDKLVMDFVNELHPKNAAGVKGKASLGRVRQQGKRLYDLLLGPAFTAMGTPKTLVVSPTGSLRYVPFAALHDGNQWVIEKSEVLNVTALDREKFAQRAPKGRKDLGLMALVDPDGTLPATRVELDGVKNILPNVAILEGEKASTTTLRQKVRVPGYEVVHFATHGRLDPKNPELSNIVLADSPLNYSDIPSLDPKKTELVVLSACQTAMLSGGSGLEIAGLAYQFQRSRVHSVIATLWEVDDQATADLMTRFYGGLRDGLTYREALSEAQRGLIATPGFEHPGFWGPFILMGTP
jgi:CHAT domain-containing protein